MSDTEDPENNDERSYTPGPQEDFAERYDGEPIKPLSIMATS
jgi:hypothetical protein